MALLDCNKTISNSKPAPLAFESIKTSFPDVALLFAALLHSIQHRNSHKLIPFK